MSALGAFDLLLRRGFGNLHLRAAGPNSASRRMSSSVSPDLRSISAWAKRPPVILAEHLGGRSEPIGDAFGGAVFSDPSGDDGAPGLKAALELRDGS